MEQPNNYATTITPFYQTTISWSSLFNYISVIPGRTSLQDCVVHIACGVNY